MNFRWSAKELPNENLVNALSKEAKISAPLAAILIQRNILTARDAEKFFSPKIEHLHDPFLMKDMEKAINRIEKAIAGKEKILVYGDYDVDGTTAVALTYSYFRNFNQQMEYYIPDRYAEGYGISKMGIEYAAQNGFKLVIALDCGIRSNALIDYANSLGVEFIICDHHLPGPEVPKAVAILNPKQQDCEYPYKELSGCGIGYKLIEAYSQKNGLPGSTHEEYLDMVAVSIASDLVDIRGENRVLAYFGLKKLAENPGIGLQALMEGSASKKEYSISDVVFGIGPRINAAGRVGDAKAAVKMLIEKDFNTARQFAKVLHNNNHERKGLDTDITREAIEMVEKSDVLKKKMSTVLHGENWHKGVIGIVASRLVEQFYKPTIVFSRSDEILTGSARSVKDFDIHEAIGACGDLVEQFGGHKYAAGLSVKVENYEAFTQKFESVVQETLSDKSLVPEIEFDLELTLDDIDYAMMNSIKKMAPFGPGNMLPVFKSENLYSNGSARVLKEKHLKLVFNNNGQVLEGIGFGLGYHLPLVTNSNRFKACYSLEENTFNGRTSIQMRLKDIKPD